MMIYYGTLRKTSPNKQIQAFNPLIAPQCWYPSAPYTLLGGI